MGTTQINDTNLTRWNLSNSKKTRVQGTSEVTKGDEEECVYDYDTVSSSTHQTQGSERVVPSSPVEYWTEILFNNNLILFIISTQNSKQDIDETKVYT